MSDTVLVAVLVLMVLALFYGTYQLGYFTGRLVGLKDEKKLLDEWEASDKEILAAWEKDFDDMREIIKDESEVVE
jgi:hypothetical protein